jgi:hypothetical protein
MLGLTAGSLVQLVAVTLARILECGERGLAGWEFALIRNEKVQAMGARSGSFLRPDGESRRQTASWLASPVLPENHVRTYR